MIQAKIASAKRILIKIGTATVTKNQKVNTGWIKTKAKEIAELKKQGKEVIMITSGAVAAGMEIEKTSKRPKDTLGLQLLSGKGQVRLMKIYKDIFNELNVQIAQILLTHHNFESKEEVKNIKAITNAYLKEGTIPIINTNDVITNEEIMGNSHNKFTDNDELASLVSEKLGINLLLILTDVDGLCTTDPRRNTCFSLVKLVENVDKKVEQMASKEGSIMGTGGMLSKVHAAKRLGKVGIPTIVAHGKYNLKEIIENKVDRTLFLG